MDELEIVNRLRIFLWSSIRSRALGWSSHQRLVEAEAATAFINWVCGALRPEEGGDRALERKLLALAALIAVNAQQGESMIAPGELGKAYREVCWELETRYKARVGIPLSGG